MWVLGRKLERCTYLEFKMHLNFSIEKSVNNVHLIFEVIWYIKWRTWAKSGFRIARFV
jgi:hypothetical protein